MVAGGITELKLEYESDTHVNYNLNGLWRRTTAMWSFWLQKQVLKFESCGKIWNI